MQIEVNNVRIGKEYTLCLQFSDGKNSIFDVKPYLNKGIFKKLQDKKAFDSVHLENGTIAWNGWQDFCVDTLYSESVDMNLSKI